MSWFSRLSRTFRSRRLDADIDEELQQHLEHRTAYWVASGLNPKEAAARARRDFGNLTKLHEQGREIRLSAFVDSVGQDVAFALRSMRKNPGFVATAVLSLGLAIGAVTAVYAIVGAAAFRPLPVSQSQQLITLSTGSDYQSPGEPDRPRNQVFDYPLLQDLRTAAGSAAQLELFSWPTDIELTGGDAALNPKALRQYVSGSGFAMLGVTPGLGRLISPADDRLPNGNNVAVLSYDFWSRQFGQDPHVIGRLLRTTDRTYRVIGVTRPGFFGAQPGNLVDLWVPAATYDPVVFHSPHYNWFFILGRLRSGSEAQLAARLQPAYYRRETSNIGDIPPDWRKLARCARIFVEEGKFGVSTFRRDFGMAMAIVFAVAVCLMLIACANVASLLLARGTARTAELAMRLSLGASRFRLLRQLLTESVVLASLSAVLGWSFAKVLAPLQVAALSTPTATVRFDLLLDTRVLFACTAIALAAALLFGGAPAFQMSRTPPIHALRSTSGQASKLHLGRFIVSAQVAGAFCLVISGAAFIFTLGHLLSLNKGFDASHVTVLEIGNNRMGQPSDGKVDTGRQILNRLSRRPGIDSAAAAMWPILIGASWTQGIEINGEKTNGSVMMYPVSETYFETMRTPLLAGRFFASGDRQDAKIMPVLVNAAMAKKYFGSTNILGRDFSFRDGGDVVRQQIVGIVADAFYSGLRKAQDAIVYLPLGRETSVTLYIRSSKPTADILRIAAREAAALGTHVRTVTPLETLVGNTIMREKLLAGLGGAFGFFGLLLAAIGLFGLLNYSVARRTRELGIRSALGATRTRLVRFVTRDLAQLLLTGLGAGLLASFIILPLLRNLLFGMQPFDRSLFVVTALCFLAIAIIAGSLPAQRAASIDPNIALREE